MNQWWQMWQGLFSKKTCNDLIMLGKKLAVQDSTIGHGSGTIRTDSNIRRSKVRWINREGRFVPLWDRIVQLINQANDAAFRFDLTKLQPLQFTKYNAEDRGYYDWHTDLDWVGDGGTDEETGKGLHRKLSCVLQLTGNNKYEGGDLELSKEIERPDPVMLRTIGTFLVFPSFLKHRVTPVTRGVRHSLVGWYEGPRFK